MESIVGAAWLEESSSPEASPVVSVILAVTTFSLSHVLASLGIADVTRNS